MCYVIVSQRLNYNNDSIQQKEIVMQDTQDIRIRSTYVRGPTAKAWHIEYVAPGVKRVQAIAVCNTVLQTFERVTELPSDSMLCRRCTDR